MPEAARVYDIIKHSSKLLGWAAGAAAGAVIGVAVVASGGLAISVLAAAAAGAAVGAGVGLGIGAIADAWLTEFAGVKTGVIEEGSATIRINDRAAVSILDQGNCCFPVVYQHYAQTVVEGSGTVYFHCCPASRNGDSLFCDARITTGSSNVIIGGPAVRVQGTKGTCFDTALSYSSWLLTGISFGTGPLLAAATLGASSILSYTINRLSQASWVPWVDFGMRQTVGNFFDMGSAYRYGAGYYRYIIRQTRYGTHINLPFQWEKHHEVKGMLKRHNVSLSAADISIMGAGFIIDMMGTYRDAKRERNIPKRADIRCGDSSWLEPA